MSAALVHAREWDTDDVEHFVGLGVGRDEVFLYEYRDGTGSRTAGFDTEDVVRCFDYSVAAPPLVAYGLNSGAIHLRELQANATGAAVFKQRTTRKCTALSFGASGGLLAAGYDRARGSDSLLLWDLGATDRHEPAASIPISETVAAVKFAPSDAVTGLVGGARMLRTFDTRTNTITSSVSSPLCSSISFSPHNDALVATYGEQHSVALWDRRTFGDSEPEPLLVIPRVFRDTVKLDARCLRFSHLNENELAALQDGITIRKWHLSTMPSRRGPASQLTSGLHGPESALSSGIMAHDSQYSSPAPAFSPTSPGTAPGTGTATGTGTADSSTRQPASSSGPGPASTGPASGHASGHASTASAGPTGPTSAHASATSAHGSHATSMHGTGSVPHGSQSSGHSGPHGRGSVAQLGVPPLPTTHDDFGAACDVSLFVNKVTDMHTDVDKVVSFDFANNKDFVCLRQSGTLFRAPVPDPPSSIYLDPFNSFKMTVGSALYEVSRDGTLTTSQIRDGHIEPPIAAELDATGMDGFADADSEGSGSDHASDSDSDVSDTDAVPEWVLAGDITSTMQQRALAGYSLDAARNIEIVAAVGSGAGPGLRAVWKWVDQQSGANGSRSYLETPEVDLRYIGVLNVWEGLSPATLQPRLAHSSKLSGRTVNDAIKYAVKRAPGSVFVSTADWLTAHRELCLRLTGWDFGLSELEPRLVELEEKGQFEKAAGWAVFHNNIERAVESLAKSRKKNLRLMSTAVAGYLVYKDVPTNNVWREQCRRLASELSGPYLRAIFAYISDGSWLDVLDDGSLPLVERIGIALRFLPQKDVGKYFALLTSRAVANGDLEGIVLTGFTPEILDLLQAYLDRTGDVQTVCLLSSFGWPRYFEDERLPTWFSEYRLLLNSWQYFSQRARLDIARNRLGASKYAHTKPPISGQAFLKCSNCKQLIGVEAARKIRGKTPVPIWNRCPSCNHSLPPCGVCALPLGPSLDDEKESDRWPTFCLKCNHGFHSVHARQWFAKYDMCPVPSCSCLCAKTRQIHTNVVTSN